MKQEIYKLSSISLCSNTVGQIATGIMVFYRSIFFLLLIPDPHPQVNGPHPGDESFQVFTRERDAILGSMKRRAILLSTALNKMEGISCTHIDGAMYAFPTIKIPGKNIAMYFRLVYMFIILHSKSRFCRGKSRSPTGRILLHAPFGRNRYRCGTRFWFWTSPRHFSLPHYCVTPRRRF